MRSTGGPIDAGSHAARADGQVARCPTAMNSPPPPSTNATSFAAAASLIGTSFRMMTRARFIASPASASGDCIEASKRGASPIASARDRYNVASDEPCDTAITGTGAVGVTVKLNTLSRASASTDGCAAVPRRTTARVFGAVMVTGANDTDADAFAAAAIRRLWTTRPSITSSIGTSAAAVAVRFDHAGGHGDALRLSGLAPSQQRHRRRAPGSGPARPRPPRW